MSNLKCRMAKSFLMVAVASIVTGCAVPRAVQTTQELSNQGHLEEAIDVLQKAKKKILRTCVLIVPCLNRSIN